MESNFFPGPTSFGSLPGDLQSDHLMTCICMGSFFSYPFWNNIRAKVNILTTLHFHQKQAMLIHLKLGLLVFGRLAPKDWWVKALIGGRLGLSRGFSIAPGNCAPAKVSFYSHNSPCSNSPRTPSD